MTGEIDYQLPYSVVGWIKNHAAKNYWRVAAHYDLEDLVQDGLMCAYKCKARYGVSGVDIDAPHFMALVKTSFHNHIGDLLRRRRVVDDSTKIADLSSAPGATEESILDRLITADVSMAELAGVIRDLPAMLRRVVMVYVKHPDKIRRKFRQHLSGPETMPQRLSRLTGFPEDKDFETELRASLWERDNVAL